MRYDQSMRVVKQILDRGAIGETVFAEIDMHAIPHWQGFLENYDRLTLSNMSVHHLDVLRYLFGEVEAITTLARKDPRTTLRPYRRHHRLHPRLRLGRDGGFVGGCLVGAARARLSRRPIYRLAHRGDAGRRQGNDRLADRRRLDADLCVDQTPAANG